jgi:UDP-N-acetylmuramoyl-L-alanyl-D-glutamate--2,6-diaminopimelate ligase
MLLAELLNQPNLPICKINQICNDSRKITPGDLFIAYPGVISDGRQYITQAIKLGAAAILYDPCDNFVIENCNIPCIAMENLANQLSNIACRFYANPSAKLSVIGVTGTNGKTTIAYQLAQAYELLGMASEYIGTLGTGNIHALKASNNTTPDALFLQQLLHTELNSGVKYVCMEVSSHALCQHRVDNVNFKQAIYTNLSHEHLDYHHTMTEYAQAKAKLFCFESLELVIINQDDLFANLMQEAAKCKILTYGLSEGCDIRALNINMHMTGSTFDVITPWGQRAVNVEVLGEFNIYNSLAVLSSLLGSGVSLNDAVGIMARLKASPGRMEIVAKQPCVVVDYAHTPDALKNVLTSLIKLKSNTGKLWVVFGCGGDRDSTKRPLMGKIASELADNIIITSDNPRSESPENIINAIAEGILPGKNYIKIADRKEAITYALTNSSAEDLIVIAGKGHESYQLIGDKCLNFSDQDVVREIMANFGYEF